MITVAKAREIILNEIFSKEETELLKFSSCLGRVSAMDIDAKENIPPFNNSAMDGFAIRANDSKGASEKSPAILEVIEDLPAGYIAKKTLKSFQAVRIMTGAALPKGADSVVMVEDTKSSSVVRRSSFVIRNTECRIRNTVKIFKEVKKGENVRYAGEDIRRDEVVIKKGTILKSGHIGILASLGYLNIKVFRRPKIAILATGDELVEVGQRLKPGKIRNSNAYSLYSQVLKAGGVPLILGIARDRRDALAEKIGIGIKADMLLVSGGISVGDYDFVKDVLRDLGGEMKFWKVAMRPGKPLAFGVIKKTPVFGLPGNPVSSMVSFEIFVRPAILKMLGQKEDHREDAVAILEERIEKKKGLRYFLRAVTRWTDSNYFVRTTGPQGSGILKSMALANSLIILHEGIERVRRGEKVTVRFLE